MNSILSRLCKLESASGTGGGSGAFVADGSTRITPATPILLNQITGDETALTLNYTTNKTAGGDTGLLINQTDTLSPGTSKLLDLQVGGVSKLSVDSNGHIGIGTAPSPAYSLKSAGTVSAFQYAVSAQSGTLHWIDVALRRDAAYTLAQQFGVNAQTFNIYNTYTNTTEYERAHIGWNDTADTFVIGTEALGTGVARDIVIKGGNVGIGTTTPRSELEVAGRHFTAAGRETGLLLTGPTEASGLFTSAIGFRNSGGDLTAKAAISGVQESGDQDVMGLAMFVHSSQTGSDPMVEALRINNLGNVGIGTTTPTAELQVIGNIHAGTGCTATFSNFIGANAGQSSSGNYCVGIGDSALENNTSSTSVAVGYKALRDNVGISSVGVGHNAGLSNLSAGLTAVGYQSAKASSGTYRTAIGYESAFQDSGNSSTFIGYRSGYNNTPSNCTGVGYSALQANTGINCAAVGYGALNNNTGSSCVAVGYTALMNNTGTNSVGVGFSALNGNTGTGNTALGMYALTNNGGAYNVGAGYQAGRYQSGTTTTLTTATSSVFLGRNTKGVQGATNQVVLGAEAQSLGANSVVLGNASIATTALRGNVGIGTTTPDANAALDVSSTTKAFLPPRMTTLQKGAIASPVAGMVVYDTDLNKLSIYEGASWVTTLLDNLNTYFAPQTLTDAATIVYDTSSGVNAVVTLGADRTLAAITNAVAGQSGTLYVAQDGTGGRALTLDASQADVLGTLADIAGMAASETAVIAWSTVDGTNFKLWVSVDV